LFTDSGVQHIMGLYVLLCLSFPCVPYVASFSGVSTFSYPFGNVALTFIQFVFTSICFVRSDILFDVICIYLCILVFRKMSISHDVTDV
jgi:hypothetical protein